MPLNVKIPKNVFAAAKTKLAENGSGEYGEDIKLNPGRHVAIVKRLDITDVKGETKFIFRLQVAGESEQAGGQVSIWFTMNEEHGHHALRALQKLGYEDVDQGDLETIQDDIAKANHVVRITAKDGGEYSNIYLDKKLEELTAADVGGDDAKDATNEGGAKGLGKNAPVAAKGKSVPTPEKDAETVDDLDGLDRNELKEIIETEEVEIAVKKSTTDDELRAAIREKRAASGGDDTPPSAQEPAGEVSIEVGMAVKFPVKGKKTDGKVVGVDEDSGVVKIKAKDGTIHKVTDLETLELV